MQGKKLSWIQGEEIVKQMKTKDNDLLLQRKRSEGGVE